MLFIGLTGSIATGKSTVAKIFEKFNCYVIDADKLAHSVYKKGQPAYYKIIKEFGEDVLDSSLSVDRKKLGDIVLKDKNKLSKLELIVHPEIEKMRNTEIENILRKDKNAIVVYDVPLLFEKHLEDMFDYTVVVYTDKETEIKRLTEREQITQEEAKERISLQMPIEQKIGLADFVIDNSKDLDNTEQQVKKIVFKLRQKVNETGK